VDFPVETAVFEEMNALSSEEVEVVARNVRNILVDGGVEVAALHYVEPERFGGGIRASVSDQAFGIRIVEENVSIARARKEPDQFTDYGEDIVPIRSESEIAGVLAEAGYVGAGADGMAEAVAILLGSPTLQSGYVLRLGIETRESIRQIVRASIYNQRQHVLTVALDDARRYVRGSEPEANPAVFAAFETSHQPVAQASGDLPTVYDGIYRATSSHGLTQPMTRQLVQLLATKVDFESPADPTDQIEVFFSQPDENDKATGDSELLYIKTNFGGTARTFYRFQMEDGTTDYFDEAGRSVRQFLLRNPIPTGQFTSGFGNRRHPILGYARAHTGVDWAAPRGTPILASGDGIVEQAGWNGGYGQQTVIRHANGYQTTFNHQSKIADGVVPGAPIRQGQIIGYVGSTGLSTGNHLHYELIINGTKVDPMRIRLPAERTLTGDELQAFLTERRRIDDLLLRSAGDLRIPAQNI
ncbi:MAG: peptidoglycan DD-metalloendopeptidase family protein, partial [Afipia sp.]|nr:peptidoglycan DD-metalloendopeptidase family protein [Afipia sp.]